MNIRSPNLGETRAHNFLGVALNAWTSSSNTVLVGQSTAAVAARKINVASGMVAITNATCGLGVDLGRLGIRPKTNRHGLTTRSTQCDWSITTLNRSGRDNEAPSAAS
jgi:hypothetical protein